jgi:peptidoglycan/LPS O-acetylase OafA/YrhL
MGLIRFILACAVVLCHSAYIFGYAPVTNYLAVQCFYIISGFYMAMILNEKYTGRGSNFLFYTNRALKIYPIYWVILILLVGWDVLAYATGCYPQTLTTYMSGQHLSFLTLLVLIAVNLLVFGMDVINFTGINKNGNLYFTDKFLDLKTPTYKYTFNYVGWTIGVELLFYLVAPFIVRRKWLLPLLLLVLSLATRIILAAYGLERRPWIDMFFGDQLMFFMGGVLSYRLYKYLEKVKISKGIQTALYLYLLAVILLYNVINANDYVKQVILFVSTILIIPFAFRLTNKNKFDRFVGELSYPIYISQLLVLQVVSLRCIPKPFGPGVTALVLVVIFSIILNRFVAGPIERYRQKRVRKADLLEQPVL